MSSLAAEPDTDPFGWATPLRIALLLFLIVAGWSLVDVRQEIAGMTMGDTDDALRLVQVRDLLGGQGWWDISQHRINPLNGGGLMHWSRIVDAPLAAGIALLTPVTGTANAERIVAALWPLALMALVFAVMAQILARVGTRASVLVGLAMLASSTAILFQFKPLRIDHHGWQILLGAVMLMAALRPPSWRPAMLSGVAGAALLAISLEGLPLTMVFAGIYALPWLRGFGRGQLSSYLVALAGGAILLQLVTRGPTALVSLWCDAVSAPYLVALSVAAVLVLIVQTAMEGRGGLLVRAFVLVAVGAAAAAALLMVAPLCIEGPFATLDPLVVRYWYAGIDEGAPVWRADNLKASYMLAPVLVGLIGTLLALRAASDEDARRHWQIIGIATFGAGIVGLLVLRSGSTAQLFALPGCAWLALAIWRRARAIARPLPRVLASAAAVIAAPPAAGNAMVALLLATGVTSTAAIGHAVAQANAPETPWDDARTLGPLADMPPTTILAPLDLGPHVLQHSAHSVLATGHHRNNAAMTATIAAFTSPVDRAEAVVRSTGMQLIVIRPAAADIKGYATADPASLAAALLNNAPPDWLRPVVLDPASPLRAWQIVPPPA
jgi:hypothetical protein